MEKRTQWKHLTRNAEFGCYVSEREDQYRAALAARETDAAVGTAPGTLAGYEGETTGTECKQGLHAWLALDHHARGRRNVACASHKSRAG